MIIMGIHDVLNEAFNLEQINTLATTTVKALLETAMICTTERIKT